MKNLNEIGPQYKQDTSFTARMRFHQSWYRANVLNASFGHGPKKNSPNKYGNMLTPQGGEKGQNFLTQEIFQLAKARVEQKIGAVDGYRLFCNMLSSMPMAFNLFGPLKNDLRLATKLFKPLIPNNLSEVTNLVFEFNPSPRKDYLNDRTAFDVFVESRDSTNRLAFIGIEFKLTEPFSQTKHTNPKYDEWTNTPDSPWKSEYRKLLVEKDVNQLWRNHLLVYALQHVQSEKYANGYFMTIYHQDDEECKRSLKKYFSYLDIEHSASEYSLETIAKLWKPLVKGTKYQKWLDGFIFRYLDLSASEKDYQAYLAA